MLVNWKIPGSSAGWTLLFDETKGDANEKFLFQFADSVMKIPGYGAPNTAKLPMANTNGSTPFKWTSTYGSADLALAAMATLRTAFKGITVHLQLIQGGTTLYLPNANLTGSSHDVQGASCTHELKFETDDITTTEPA
ncbi:MAG TPA: hypothetical protein VK742_20470 [Candidatus Sulfotelmatobacter sp.]|jgi:hypothetical protein|nr:hypothetical protein [Candidatus Sulfotelmatobacter sp.]